MGYLLVHTKITILYYELWKNLMVSAIPLMLTGKLDSGKSTFVKLVFNSLKSTSSLTRVPSSMFSQSQSPVFQQSLQP